jgi:hypothetical protein
LSLRHGTDLLLARALKVAVLVLGGAIVGACNRHAASLDSGRDPAPPKSNAPAQASAPAAASTHFSEPAAEDTHMARERALQGAANGFGSCDTNERSWRVRVKARNRQTKTLKAIQQQLQAQEAVCEPSGWIELFVTSKTLQRLFGAHLELRCTAGMGNSTDAPDLSARVTPDGYLPKELSAHVALLHTQLDPKSELFGDVIDCAELFVR